MTPFIKYSTESRLGITFETKTVFMKLTARLKRQFMRFLKKWIFKILNYVSLKSTAFHTSSILVKIFVPSDWTMAFG